MSGSVKREEYEMKYNWKSTCAVGMKMVCQVMFKKSEGWNRANIYG